MVEGARRQGKHLLPATPRGGERGNYAFITDPTRPRRCSTSSNTPRARAKSRSGAGSIGNAWSRAGSWIRRSIRRAHRFDTAEDESTGRRWRGIPRSRWHWVLPSSQNSSDCIQLTSSYSRLRASGPGRLAICCASLRQRGARHRPRLWIALRERGRAVGCHPLLQRFTGTHMSLLQYHFPSRAFRPSGRRLS